jgi:methylenetetrahydrofolate reductase (NADPH)
MRIDEIIATRAEPVFSFEFFPPKTEEGERNLQTALRELGPLEPSYVSVTYGAGGSTRDRTIEIVKSLKDEHGLEAMAHLSCVGTTQEELRAILDEVRDAGIDNVLALRGDPPQGEAEWRPHPGGLHYSTELATLIREHYDVCIGAACFPEVHPEAVDLAHDLKFLKEKVAAGATFLITQLFFDNRLYFDFVDEARAVGIDVPIIPGIMPFTNYKQIKRITDLCGAKIPDHFGEELEARKDNEDALKDLGVAYATLQCSDLLARGAPGIHFYTLNRSPATRAILGALKLQRPWLQASSSISSASATRGEPSGAA